MRKLYTAEPRTFAYLADTKWRTEWCVYRARRRVCTATSERMARQIARALNDANPQPDATPQQVKAVQ